MKLYCLSGRPSRPCFVLSFRSTTIMLDCGLDTSTLTNFLPLPLVDSQKSRKASSWVPKDVGLASPELAEELKEHEGRVFVDGEPEFSVPEIGMVDMSEVDVILISNFHCMLALPYITEYTNFKGTVYATEPTLHIGRLYMEEMVRYMERSNKCKTASFWKDPQITKLLPAPLRDCVSTRSWRKCYNLYNIQSSVNKIQKLAFNEAKVVFGGVSVTAASAGYCLGSCNWIIQSAYEKIVYMSGSSTLTTHPRPMDQTSLKKSDVLILTCLTQAPTSIPDAMIGEFCINTALTLKAGGNVLVPCSPSGVLYDLLEVLSGHLDTCGLGAVPMYFISPVADSSLAYSNIYAECCIVRGKHLTTDYDYRLSSTKQSKIYLPECPFPHAELLRTKQLLHFSSLEDIPHSEMRSPCVVFTGHCSLRFGYIVHLLELWKSSLANAIIFTEPDFDYLEALAPYQPLMMKAFYCPIDTSLSFPQANKLLRELNPRHIVIPEQYTVPPPSQYSAPQRPDVTIDSELPTIVFRKADILNLPVKRKFDRVEMTTELADSLVPVEIQQGVGVAMVTGKLFATDNKYVLAPMLPSTESGVKVQPSDRKTYTYGALDVHELLRSLKQRGIDAKLDNRDARSGLSIIELVNEDTLIHIERGSTHIIGQGNEILRVQVKDSLIECLNKLS